MAGIGTDYVFRCKNLFYIFQIVNVHIIHSVIFSYIESNYLSPFSSVCSPKTTTSGSPTSVFPLSINLFFLLFLFFFFFFADIFSLPFGQRFRESIKVHLFAFAYQFTKWHCNQERPQKKSAWAIRKYRVGAIEPAKMKNLLKLWRISSFFRSCATWFHELLCRSVCISVAPAVCR